jgi:glycosyltransferase involved in cell wall biosynthesis
MTGGLQDQVTDGENWFGIGIEPSSKAIIGSQQVPYIYEDRLNKDDFLNALEKMYNMSAKERHELGQKAAEWSRDFFGFDKFIDRWDKLFTEVHEKNGSWDTRENYTPYEVKVF